MRIDRALELACGLRPKSVAAHIKVVSCSIYYERKGECTPPPRQLASVNSVPGHTGYAYGHSIPYIPAGRSKSSAVNQGKRQDEGESLDGIAAHGRLVATVAFTSFPAQCFDPQS